MRRGPDASYELSPEAIDDIAEALSDLDAESPEAAERPQARTYGCSPPSRAVRFWAVDRHLIVYRLRDKTLQVVAVLHASRDLEELLRQR